MRNDPLPGVAALAAFVRIAPFTAVLVAAQPLKAQSMAADSARLDSVRAVLLRVPLESPIRILTVGQSIIEGRLAARSDTGIVLHQRRDSSRASIARIATIWRPARNIKSGVVTGGLVGGLVGALALGALASGLCDRADCHGAFAEGATVGAALGVGVGAAVGIGVGALTHHWQQVWP